MSNPINSRNNTQPCAHGTFTNDLLDKHRNKMIGGVALVALGIACAYVYNGYSLYHFNSGQLRENQGNPLITQSHQEIRQDLHQLNPQFEQPLCFTSEKISTIEPDAVSAEEPRLLNKINSFVSSFWPLDGKSISHYTTTSFFSVDGIEMPFYREAVKINLYSLHAMTDQERQEVIEKFQLQSSIDLLGNEVFFKKLAEVDKHILELANLVDLKFYNKASGLKYILLTNAEFNELTLDELKNISLNQKRAIIERLKDTKKSNQNPITGNILQLPLVRFSNLTSKEINQFIDSIPANIFSLLSDDQLRGLDLSKASEDQINNLFCHITETDEKRFALLPADQVNKILDKLNNYQMYLISDEQMKKLDLSRLNEDHLKKMFNDRISMETDEKRFALLPADQVNKILDKLNNYQMYLISDEQMKQLDLSKLAESHLRKMFNNRFNSETDEKRFALLLADQVNKILDKLDNYQMYLISDEQMKQLDLSKLNEDHLKKMFNNRFNSETDEKRFALLPADQVNKILDKLNNYQMYLISDEQMKKLDLSKLNEDHLKKMFNNRISAEFDEKRFALLPADQVNKILDKLNNYQMYLISDEQMKQLDLSKLNEDHLKKMFNNRISAEFDKKRFALLSKGQVDKIVDKLNDYQKTLISKS